nr:MAG TPA: hypothetical protein [Bacteriophage sp.]
MKKFWCNGKKGICSYDGVRDCGGCEYQDGTGGAECEVNDQNQIISNIDELCALRDQVYNLTLYLKEAFELCPDDLEVLNDWHPGLPGYAPEK